MDDFQYSKAYKGRIEKNIMSEKAISDRIRNIVLLMYLVRKTNEKFVMEDNLKVQKLVFLSQKELTAKKMNGFAYLFLRWLKGPFSGDLNNDIVLLKQMKLLRWGDDRIELTEEGEHILESLHEIMENNKGFSDIIDDIIEEYGFLSPDEMKEKVYQMEIVVPKDRKVMRIEEIPPKKLILFGLSRKNTEIEFNINEEWLDTLEVLFDDEAIQFLERLKNSAVEGNIIEFS